MRFDDRLLTVLELATPAPRDRAVQWRQLVELVARGAAGGDTALRDRALGRLAETKGEVPEAVRAAAARAIAGPAVPKLLVTLFAADNAEIAAPLLTAVDLDEAGWDEVRTAASPSVRALLAALRPKAVKALPIESIVVPEPASEPVFPSDSSPKRPQAPTLPPTEPGLFRWECGQTGEIDWVEGAPRAALIGRSISDELDNRFSARQPFRDEALASADEGPLAGEWRWSGTPAFFPDTGRFAGYRGVARRYGLVAAVPAERSGVAGLNADDLRELVHELRTPLNAISGFGEIIVGQYLGPAHLAYRERAGQIVHQAQRLLGAVDDLDFSAKLQSGRAARGPGTALDEIVPALRQQLGLRATNRGVTLSMTMRTYEGRLALDRELAERLIGRFGEAIIDAAAANEHLELVINRVGPQFAVSIDRPEATRGIGDEALLVPAFVVGGGSGLGLGFALRLVRGLASMAGGRLDVARDRLTLLIPLAEG